MRRAILALFLLLGAVATRAEDISSSSSIGGVSPSGTFTAGDLVVGAGGASIKDSVLYGFNGGISLSGGTVPTYGNCFWNDVDSCTSVNIRMRGRVFVGNAVLMTDNSPTCCVGTWLGTNSATMSPVYVARDAQLLSMQDHGGIAISGLSRSSDAGTVTPRETVGIGGYALMNASGLSGEAVTAWGGYYQCDSAPTGGVKENWRDINPESALAVVMKMRPGSFNYRSGRGLPVGEQVGFAAEQIALLDDRLVGRRPGGDIAGVRYQQASSLYAGAIQALEIRLQALEMRALK